MSMDDILELIDNTFLGKKVEILSTTKLDDDSYEDNSQNIAATSENGEFEYYDSLFPAGKIVYKNGIAKQYFPRHETFVQSRQDNYQRVHPLYSIFSDLEYGSGLRIENEMEVYFKNWTGSMVLFKFKLQGDIIKRLAIFESPVQITYEFKITEQSTQPVDDYGINDLSNHDFIKVIEINDPCLECALRPEYYELEYQVIKKATYKDYSYRNGVFESKNKCGWVRIFIDNETIRHEIIKECEEANSSVDQLYLGNGFKQNMLKIFNDVNKGYRRWFVGKAQNKRNERFAHLSYGISCHIWRPGSNIGFYELLEKDKNTFELGGSLIFKRVE